MENIKEQITESVYNEMKLLVERYESHTQNLIVENPYLKNITINTEYTYNHLYGDYRVCICGHQYYRHFDTYEDMEACGCKYCQCSEFVEFVGEYDPNIEVVFDDNVIEYFEKFEYIRNESKYNNCYHKRMLLEDKYYIVVIKPMTHNIYDIEILEDVTESIVKTYRRDDNIYYDISNIVL